MSKTRKFLIILLSLIAVGCAAYSIHYFTKRAANSEIYDKVQKDVVKPLVIPADDQPEQPYESPIDFAKLKAINPDIYAWVQIANTNINYPVAQSATDKDYYLNHTIEHKAGLPGAIFTENLNKTDFSDYNTVIYGHNMRNGTMFKQLHKYENPEFLKTNNEIIIYTPTRKLVYNVFAAVSYSDESILDKYDFSDRGQRLEFLASLQQGRSLRDEFSGDAETLADQKLLTLSTCEGNIKTSRYIVVAALTEE